MNIHPNITQHPKFRLFKRKLGDPSALEYLVRIWGHCQTAKRGGCWGVVTPGYVEAIADWNGTPGVLYAALVEPFEGKLGWVHLDKNGRFIVTEWEEHNLNLLKSWRVGPLGGRPKKQNLEPNPKDNPEETLRLSQGKPNGNPKDNPEETLRAPSSPPLLDLTGHDLTGDRSSLSQSGAGAHIPSLLEVQDFCRGAAGIDPEYGREFWEAKNDKPQERWFDRTGNLVNWRNQLARFWSKDRANWASKRSEGPGGRPQGENIKNAAANERRAGRAGREVTERIEVPSR